jgi:hypothetical protein
LFGLPSLVYLQRGCPYQYVTWGMDNRPVGRSSETVSHARHEQEQHRITPSKVNFFSPSLLPYNFTIGSSSEHIVRNYFICKSLKLTYFPLWMMMSAYFCGLVHIETRIKYCCMRLRRSRGSETDALKMEEICSFETLLYIYEPHSVITQRNDIVKCCYG